MNKKLILIPIFAVAITLSVVLYPQEVSAHGNPSYTFTNLAVYQDATTVLGAGTGICLTVDLESASTCGTDLETGVTYRFEFTVTQTSGDTGGTPTRFDAQSVIGNLDVFGTTPSYGSAGCTDDAAQNNDWTSSTVSTATQVDSGTGCLLAKTSDSETFYFIVTLGSDADDDTATFFITDGTDTDTSTTTTFTVIEGPANPVYSFNNIDVYESESTALNSGNLICSAATTTCSGVLIVGHTYRFEANFSETAGAEGTPTTLDIDSAVADYDVLGNIVAGQIISAGCDTNTNWTGSIVSTDARASSGTGCAINSGSADFWIIIRINSDAGSGALPTATFTIDDGSVSDTSGTITFTVDNQG